MQVNDQSAVPRKTATPVPATQTAGLAALEIVKFSYTFQELNHVSSVHIGSVNIFRVGRDSSVGIATRYGLDGTGIESRWGRDISHPPNRTYGPPSPPYNGYRVFPGGKAAGA
jgi:hypothetical protein